MLNLNNIITYVDQKTSNAEQCELYLHIKRHLDSFIDGGGITNNAAVTFLLTQITTFSADIQIFLDNYLSQNPITLFYTDILNDYVGRIPNDAPLHNFIQQTTLIYNTLRMEYIALEQSEFKFSQNVDGKFKNLNDSLLAIKQCNFDSTTDFNKINNVMFDPIVAARLKSYLPDHYYTKIKITKPHHQYISAYNYPAGMEARYLEYKERVRMEFAEPITTTYKSHFDEDAFLKNPIHTTSSLQVLITEETSVAPQNVVTDIKPPTISPENIAPVHITNEPDEIFTTKDLPITTTVKEEKVAAIEVTRVETIPTRIEEKPIIMPELNIQPIIDKIDTLLQFISNSPIHEAINDRIIKIAALLESGNVSTKSTSADALLKMFEDYEPDNSVNASIEDLTQKLLSFKDIVKSDTILKNISDSNTKLNELATEVTKYSDTIKDDYKLIADRFVQFDEAVRSIEQGNSDITKKLVLELTNATNQISQFHKSFGSNVEEFKIIINDGLIKSIESHMETNTDLSRKVRTLQTSIDSSRPSKQGSLIAFIGCLNILITTIIVIMMFINNGYKNDSIELSKIINNVNKLDAKNRNSVIKALDINTDK